MGMKIHAMICIFMVNIFRVILHAMICINFVWSIFQDTCHDLYLFGQYFQGDLMKMKIHTMICICLVNIFMVI